MGLFSNIFGDISSKFVGNSSEIVAKINALEAEISALQDEDFPKRTIALKEKLSASENEKEALGMEWDSYLKSCRSRIEAARYEKLMKKEEELKSLKLKLYR